MVFLSKKRAIPKCLENSKWDSKRYRKEKKNVTGCYTVRGPRNCSYLTFAWKNWFYFSSESNFHVNSNRKRKRSYIWDRFIIPLLYLTWYWVFGFGLICLESDSTLSGSIIHSFFTRMSNYWTEAKRSYFSIWKFVPENIVKMFLSYLW